jgi:hypothetical protein
MMFSFLENILIPIKDGKTLLQVIRQMAIHFRTAEKPKKYTENLQRREVLKMVKSKSLHCYGILAVCHWSQIKEVNSEKTCHLSLQLVSISRSSYSNINDDWD